ncbi:MAG: S41 family peptidase [Bryobacteraceae bacterium]|jgi:C-terminal processing protease CtpA/Prc
MADAVFEYLAPAALGKVQTLPQFLGTVGKLTLNHQKLIVQQALNLIEDVYVHLPLKKTMHAVDPVQRLRLFKRQLDSLKAPLKERAFHNEMISAFVSLRDLHTNYLLPSYFADYVAFLPFQIEEFYEDPKAVECRYVVTQLTDGFTHPDFRQGVVINYWNGMPISRAVELNADRNAGSNSEARHARGLETLTLRPMIMSLPPDEEWVIIGFTGMGGKDTEIRLPWKVFRPDADNGVAIRMESGTAVARGIGMDLVGEILRRTKVALFKPEVAEKRRSVAVATGAKRRTGAAALQNPFPDILRCITVDTPSGTFGYLRIFSFAPDDDMPTFADDFVDQVRFMVQQVPQNGLIIDVRGNGGGIIEAGERLLQLFTPRNITPERFDFINTAATGRLTEYFDDLKPWADSVALAVETSATYSQAFCLTPTDLANAVGQCYQGPVVLITDARCYSTTDIFAAGFQDHAIGKVLGTSGNTGAGGANVWEHDDLEDPLPDLFTALPDGTGMRVAVRRSTRVGDRAGMVLEELGVTPDMQHKMTLNDLFKDNVDLIAAAAAVLKDEILRVLNGVLDLSDGNLKLTLETYNVSRVDIYVDNRPTLSLDTGDGKTQVDLPFHEKKEVYLEGWADGKLVVAREVG